MVNGSVSLGNSKNSIEKGVVELNGIISGWSSDSANSVRALIYHSSIRQSNFVYLVGGRSENSGEQELNLDEVYSGLIDSSGLVKSWVIQTSLPEPLIFPGVFVFNNYLYVLGGNIDPGPVVNKDIYRSAINPVDGSLGAWENAGQLAEPVTAMGVAIFGNKVFIFGGFANGGTDHVWRGEIDQQGNLGGWIEQTPLPNVTERAGFGQTQDKILVVGGIGLNKSYYATVDQNGDLGTWTEGAPLPQNVCCGSLTVANNGYAYLTGGWNGSSYLNTVYYSQVADPIIAPTPTAVPTPTPSPTPPVQLVNRVVLVPGTGASWNADAILNCKDTGYAGGWSLAPFAKGVYRPLVQTLSDQGLEVIEFNYDWRKDIRSNAENLRLALDTELLESEKVHLVGHSMGGLVGRAYIEEGPHRLAKMMTVGAPHRGSVLAYPLWSGGETWDGDLIVNIGIQIALRRCGLLANSRETVESHFPSIRNMLPVFDYLRDKSSGELKSVESMIDQNNWLPTSFIPNLFGVEVGTLSGIGKKTLSEIVVKNRNRNDQRLGLWEDGKPASKVKVTAGDGAVLLTSSQVEGAENWVINGTHAGIVGSAEGVAKIAEFLGMDNELESLAEMTEPQSALVLVGEGTLSTDTTTEEDVLVIFDPKPGKRTYNFRPRVSKSKLEVGEFLMDGSVRWQGLSLSGLGERRRSINFGQ
jgi:pimeloyl-ACP methyl ester carboxylesterase